MKCESSVQTYSFRETGYVHIRTHTKYCVNTISFLNKQMINMGTTSTGGLEIMECHYESNSL